MTKTKQMEEALDLQSMILFGRRRTESLKTKTCVSCGDAAEEFTDELSKREFEISGLCQKCQDEVFEGGS